MSTQPNSPDINASLSSLAMLSLQLQEGRDYLDYLNGFVIDAIERQGGHAFDASVISKTVKDEFGLQIPVATYVLVLKRLSKEGKIKVTSAKLQYISTNLPASSIHTLREDTRKQIADVTEQLAGFAHARFSLPWDDISSATAIASFLRGYSIDFLKFTEGASPLPVTQTSPNSAEYVVASFVVNASKEHPVLFESIKILVQSHILANALMCPDLGQEMRGFKSVLFFADTRFLIRALDLESTYETENVRQLLAAIKSLKGAVCLFNETRDELRGVLRAVIRGMQSGNGRGPIHREFMKRRRSVADVILADAQLDERLAALGISVFPSPVYAEENFGFQIGEAELRQDIEEEVDYLSERAAEHDVRVVRHIYALRKNRRPTSIEDSGYVLLTTNSALSRAAFQYEKDNNPGWFFSAVVTDYHLSHLAWLKSPVQLPNLPRSEILASCYATMRPAEKFWNRYVTEVDRLRAENRMSPRDHEVLRFSLNAADALMEVTQGDVNGISPNNIHRILEKLEREFAREKAEELRRVNIQHQETREKLQISERALQEQQEARMRAAHMQSDLELREIETARRYRELEMKFREQHESELARKQRIEGWSETLSTGFYYFLGLAFGIMAVVALYDEYNMILGVPMAILGFLNLWCGFSGSSIKAATRNWIARKLHAWLG